MSHMITPITIWKTLDLSLDVRPAILRVVKDGDVKIEYINFSGRETGEGRVLVYAAYAYSESAPSRDGILILPDSSKSIDEDIIKMFVSRGYSVCMVDYRGAGFNDGEYTVYPEKIKYANSISCGRYKDFVDESADKTCWYEWGAVALYARKFLSEKLDREDIAIVGIRDGGEVAWKILTAEKFSCAVTICAAGWLAYKGYEKFGTLEPKLNDERYRFIAGIDSQAYAPYVKCPVLMLCSVNDLNFDYDRAYDTFSRINPEFADESAISYSISCNGCISDESTQTMFLYLDKFVRNRQIFIPKSGTVSVYVDEAQNLSASTSVDSRGIVESCNMYFAEDCLNSSIREWKNATIREHNPFASNFSFNLDIYENTRQIFVMCGVTYSNGFTVWSKIVTKKVSGRFRNSQIACNVLYSSKDGVDCFTIADYSSFAVGGIFLCDNNATPHMVVKDKEISGIYSPCGLATFRGNSDRYAPKNDSVLKFDVITDENGEVKVSFIDVETGDCYMYSVECLGGVWQSELLDYKNFKTAQGTVLASFKKKLKLTIECDIPYAINNVMWL